MLILILALVLASCAPQPTTTQIAAATKLPNAVSSRKVELNVFAAASLSGPFSEIGKIFEAEHPEAVVLFNFAGSQQLAQQINEGAPADLFASANQKQMDAVIAAGGIASGSQQIFVKNRLVVIYPRDNPAGLSKLQDLAKPGLKLVFAAVEVPVGQYSLDFLEKAAADPAFGPIFKDAVLHNVVSFEENVKAVLTKVVLGEADAGITYSSDVSGEDASKVGWLDIPDPLNVSASYPVALVIDGKHAALAQAFIDLLLSVKGQGILAQYNFVPVKQR